MGLFDAFKKKVEKTSEDINPMFNLLKNSGLSIENLDVSQNGGDVTINGTVDNGAIIEKAVEMVKSQAGITNVYSKIDIADLSHLNLKYTVNTQSSNLNVRSGASTDTDVLGKFAKDTQVQLIKKQNDTWFLVKGQSIDGQEIEGFCHTDYLAAL